MATGIPGNATTTPLRPRGASRQLMIEQVLLDRID